jgi:hypothetical protein
MTSTKLTAEQLARETAGFSGHNSILSTQLVGMNASAIFDFIGGNRADVRFTPKATMQVAPK